MDGTIVGLSDGMLDGLSDATSLGKILGTSDGISLSVSEGSFDGESEGVKDGLELTLGPAVVGFTEGVSELKFVGPVLGAMVGLDEACTLGTSLTDKVGEVECLILGELDGTVLGTLDDGTELCSIEGP